MGVFYLLGLVLSGVKVIIFALKSRIQAIDNTEQAVKDIWFDLLEENDVKVYDSIFVSEENKRELLEIADKLMKICKIKKLQIKPTVLAYLYKGSEWFSLLIKFYFSGISIDNYSDDDLGLDGVDQFCDEHKIYSYIIDKIRSVGGIRNENNYEDFMCWLVRQDFIKDIKNDSVIDAVPGWQKSMQPELCKLATDFDRCNRKGFDPNHTEKKFDLYKERHCFMKQKLLEPLI